MTGTLLSFSLVVLLVAADEKSEQPRKPHPFAPSLPELTDEEEDKIDKIINAFMQYDIGTLRGEAGVKAFRDFQRLGPESIPALVRGLNRAANVNHSCPVTVIAKKLETLLARSRDVKLMEFVKDEIGSGVGPTRHGAVLRGLRLGVTLHRNALVRAGINDTTPVTPLSSGMKSPGQMTTDELIESAGKDRGQRLKQVLMELARRPGAEAVSALGTAAGTYEKDVKDLARKLLVQNLSRQKREFVRSRFKDENVEVRLAAIRITSVLNLPLVSDLIDRLTDDNETVRETARQSLVRLARNVDFGPKKGATKEEREQAAKEWREWWAKQKR